MKRSELKRKTPMPRPSKPLRAQSSKRRKEQKARWELAADYLDTACRIPSPHCPGRAEHFHELVGRGQGGSIVDPRNLVPAADVCNSWLESQSDRYERGWKVRSSDAVAGDGGLVPAVPNPLAIAWDEVTA